MKVHLFQVAASPAGSRFEAIIQQFEALPLEERLRELPHKTVRLETALAPSTRGNSTPYWLMDFTKLRFGDGPGKVSPSTPIEGFDLKRDEGFGEQAAALYDPATKYILIQYNHYGTRSGAVQDYFNSLNVDQSATFEFLARHDDSIETRLARKTVLKQLKFKIAAPLISATQRRNNVSLTRMLDVSDDVGGATIEVTISAGRGALDSGGITKMINTMRRWGQEDGSGDDGALQKLRVKGKAALGEHTEELDLLASRLELTLSDLVLGADHRYTQESRFNALLRARRAWQQVVS